jgi:hypothetical protein
MFMTSKVQLLWREVMTARRIAEIQKQMDNKDVWKKASVYDPVQAAEDRFNREMLEVYPELMEYCFEMEKIAYEAQDKIAALRHQLNELKEVPKKTRKPRAKKAANA